MRRAGSRSDQATVSLDAPRPGLPRRAVIMLAVAAVGSFAAGAARFGLRPPGTPAAASSSPRVDGTHCVERKLRYGVTDSPSVRDAEYRFERDPRRAIRVPDPGVYDAPLDPVASLHAALHASIVVYHRPDSGPAASADLASLVDAARRIAVPLVVSPRAQRPALVGVRAGASVTCSGTTAADVRALRAFVRAQFPAIAG